MSVSGDELARIAGLANLEMGSGEAERLSAQVARILDYVAQIEAVQSDADPSFRVGPAITPMRDDAVGTDRTVVIGDICSNVEDGLVAVPRIGSMERTE